MPSEQPVVAWEGSRGGARFRVVLTWRAELPVLVVERRSGDAMGVDSWVLVDGSLRKEFIARALAGYVAMTLAAVLPPPF